MKIIIKGDAGIGKSYFFAPQIIKLLKAKRVFIIKTQLELENKTYYDAKKNSPYWESIKWEYYDKNIVLTDEDLIFIDEPFYVSDEQNQKLINEHTNILINFQSDFFEHQKYIKELENYLIINIEKSSTERGANFRKSLEKIMSKIAYNYFHIKEYEHKHLK